MMFEIRLVYCTHGDWIGLVQRDGKELYRTGKYYKSPEGALERCNEWLDETETTYA